MTTFSFGNITITFSNLNMRNESEWAASLFSIAQKPNCSPEFLPRFSELVPSKKHSLSCHPAHDGKFLLATLAKSGNFDVIIAVLSQIDSQHRLQALQGTHLRKSTLLAIIESSWPVHERVKAIHDIANLLSPDEREHFVLVEDGPYEFSFEYAAHASSELVEALLQYVKSESGKAKLCNFHAFSTRNTLIQTAMLYSSGVQKNQKHLIEVHSQESAFNRLEALRCQNNEGTALHVASVDRTISMHIGRCPPAGFTPDTPVQQVQTILNSLSSRDQKSLIETKNRWGDTALYTAVRDGNRNTVEAIFSVYPKSEWARVIKEQDLFQAAIEASDPEVFTFITAIIVEQDERDEIVSKGDTFFMACASFANSYSLRDFSDFSFRTKDHKKVYLERTLTLLSKDQLVPLLGRVHKHDTPMHLLVHSSRTKALENVLQRLTTDEIVQLFSGTVLKDAALYGSNETWQIIHRYHPAKELVDRFKSSRSNTTMLSFGLRNNSGLDLAVMLQSLTPDEIAKLIEATKNVRDYHYPKIYLVEKLRKLIANAGLSNCHISQVFARGY